MREKVLPILLLCLAGLVASGAVTASSESDLIESEQLTKASVRQLKNWIRDHGTPEAKDIDAQVGVVIEDSIVPNAMISPNSDGDGYRMRITRQLRLVYAYLADLGVLASKYLQFQACTQAYGNYLFEVHAENRQRGYKMQSLRDIDAPEVFARWYEGPCKSLDKYVPISDDLHPQRDIAVHYSFMFLYFHELGHVARAHSALDTSDFDRASTTEKKELVFLDLMRRSRSQETDADSWAVHQLIAMGIPPHLLFAAPLFQLMIANSGLDCLPESISTHPFGVTRMSNILSAIEVSYNRKYGAELPTETSKLISDTRAFWKKVGTLLKCPT